MEEKPSQTTLLYNLLQDGQPHSTLEIMEKVYGNSHLGLARCGARKFDVQKKYNVVIEGWHDKKNPTIYWYQLKKVVLENNQYKLAF